MNLNDLISLPKAAKMIGMSEHSLRRRMHEGEIPYVEIGRKFFFTPLTVANYVPVAKPALATTSASVSPKFNFALNDGPKSVPGPEDKTDMFSRARVRVLEAWHETGIPADKCLSYWDEFLGDGHV